MNVIVVHGGAGVPSKGSMSADEEKSYLSGIEESVNAGYEVLNKGGSAVDAVEIAVAALEDNVLFNAGRGSVFTADVTHEMEASIMDGSDLQAGAALGLKNVRNPVKLARTVLEKSPYILLHGKGAEKFAHENGLIFEPDNYFYSSEKYESLQQARFKSSSRGTVGAVALDSNGNLAAATSTGGLTNKK